MTVDDQSEALEGDSIWRPPYVTVTVANLTVVALVAFDGLAIVAALPSITDDLGDVALVPWVITGFLATSAIAGLAAGPFIDAVGVRRTFRVTGVWFLVTSLLVAVAPNMETLVAARVLQGLGGGLVIAVALAAVGLAYPMALRPRAFAANSMVWGTLGFGGPVIVAGLLAIGSWRLVFLAQIPLTAVALAMGWRSLPSTRDRPTRIQIDWRGIGLITALVVASLVGVASVGSSWAGASAGVVVAVACGALLWRHSARPGDPVLARVHLTRFPLRRIHLTSGLVLTAGLAADNYLPLYTRTVKGWSESAAAFSVMFLTIGWTTAAFVVSRVIGRRTEADLILLGSLLSVPTLVLAAGAAAADWPSAVVLGAYFGVGLSIGFISTAGLNLLQSSSDPAEMGRTNSAHQFIRTLSITYGVAIGGAILLFVVDRQAGDVEAVRELLGGDDTAVDPSTIDGIRDGFAAIHVFSVAAAVACVGAAVVLWRQTRTRLTPPR
ncbi:MAG: MFS transporter [Actinomycetota bacterium]